MGRRGTKGDAVRLFDAGARAGAPQVVHDRIFTLANGITALRLLGLPLFVWLVLGARSYGKAFAVLILVGSTDWVDGYVARRFDQVTKLGRLLDPVIDRLLLASAGLTLVAAGMIPPLLVVAVVVRDILLMTGALVLFRGAPAVPVSRLGKFATANLLVGLPSFLLAGMAWPGARVFEFLAWLFSLVGVVAYWVAGVRYARAARVARRLSRTDVHPGA
jgi:cardiolipin synthase